MIWLSFDLWWCIKMEGKAVNVIKFNVRGLNLLNGKLTIEASFKIASKSVNAKPLFSVNFIYFSSLRNYKTLLEVELSFLMNSTES